MTSRLRECDPAAEIYLFWVTSKYTESLQTLSILYLTNLTIQEASIFSWGQCIISVFVFAFPDPRTATWAFVPSVTSPIAAVLCYLLFIYLGPKFMANRKPFQLSFILMLYNAAMTILNLYMCVEVRPIPIVSLMCYTQFLMTIFKMTLAAIETYPNAFPDLALFLVTFSKQ